MRLLHCSFSHGSFSHPTCFTSLTPGYDSTRSHSALHTAARPLGGVGEEAAATPSHGEAKPPNPAETSTTHPHCSPFHRQACAPKLSDPYCTSARHTHLPDTLFLSPFPRCSPAIQQGIFRRSGPLPRTPGSEGPQIRSNSFSSSDILSAL